MRGTDPRTVLVANPGADLYGSDRMALEDVRALVRAGRRVFVTVPGPGPLVDLLTGAGASVLVQPTPIVRKSLASPRGLLRLARWLRAEGSTPAVEADGARLGAANVVV